jgi:hypothetical protein
VDDFHERLARVGLAAGGRHGLALAGGYAMQANGMLERSSEDVDLFAAWNRRDEFDTAVSAVIDAYAADGLQVEVDVRFETFARLYATDPVTGQTSKVELGVDWRAHEPVQLAIGPVLHPDDAVANKIGALYGRTEARDYIDVDAALTSGRYSRGQLLTLAETADSGFDRGMFAEAIGQAAALPDDDFAAYAVTGAQLAALRARFADWRSELLGSR